MGKNTTLLKLSGETYEIVSQMYDKITSLWVDQTVLNQVHINYYYRFMMMSHGRVWKQRSQVWLVWLDPYYIWQCLYSEFAYSAKNLVCFATYREMGERAQEITEAHKRHVAEMRAAERYICRYNLLLTKSSLDSPFRFGLCTHCNSTAVMVYHPLSYSYVHNSSHALQGLPHNKIKTGCLLISVSV